MTENKRAAGGRRRGKGPQRGNVLAREQKGNCQKNSRGKGKKTEAGQGGKKKAADTKKKKNPCAYTRGKKRGGKALTSR